MTIQLDLKNLTQEMVNEALPHMGTPRYDAPCLIGAMMAPGDRDLVSNLNNIGVLVAHGVVQFPDAEQVVIAQALQEAFDASNRPEFERLMDIHFPEIVL